MAEDLATTAGRAPGAAPATPAVEPRPRRRALYRGRFLAAYAVIALLAAAGVAAAYVVATADRLPGAAWSSWEPDGDESTFAQQIADQVALRYRLPSGAQLAGVVAGPPLVGNVVLRAVLIQEPDATSAEEVKTFETDDAVLYSFCGLGEGCTVREGEPTEERHRLLRRQALETALYTFTYMDGVDTVIAVLPPATVEAGEHVLFLRERDFGAELDRPLRETIGPPGPDGLYGAIGPEESIRIDRLTRPRLFTYELQPIQAGTAAAMILTPVAG